MTLKFCALYQNTQYTELTKSKWPVNDNACVYTVNDKKNPWKFDIRYDIQNGTNGSYSINTKNIFLI